LANLELVKQHFVDKTVDYKKEINYNAKISEGKVEISPLNHYVKTMKQVEARKDLEELTSLSRFPHCSLSGGGIVRRSCGPDVDAACQQGRSRALCIQEYHWQD